MSAGEESVNSLKSAEFNLKSTLRVCVIVAEVDETIISYSCGVLSSKLEIVIVTFPSAFIVESLNDTLEPAGSPEDDNVTVSEKPFTKSKFKL